MKISIIKATYNSAENIGLCVESVISQSYTNIEHIIIDGNSSDNTLEKIKNYFIIIDLSILFTHKASDVGHVFEPLRDGVCTGVHLVVIAHRLLHPSDHPLEVGPARGVTATGTARVAAGT